jgi:hypoxanthine-DNA glycosylase
MSETQSRYIKSFSPIISAESRILILGSIPGEASLCAHEYYAHPRNAFWYILYAVWPEDTDVAFGGSLPPYKDRLSFLLSRELALWDVIAACTRAGSLDSAVRSEKIQSFDSFFNAYPNIGKVLFNGRKAYEVFSRQYGFTEGKIYQLMPSTSPAHASLSFAEKLAMWKGALL